MLRYLRHLISWIILTGFVVESSGQAALDLGQYDDRIAHFESNGPRDSFLFYAGKKAQLARQAGLLELWAWIHVEVHDVQSDVPATALAYIDDVLKQAWRAPADSAECEPFMYLQTYRGYYLSAIGRIWKATEAYEAARGWFERFHYTNPDFEAVDALYKPLGNHYTRLGDNEKALVIFQKALALTPTGHPAEQAGLYNNIGIAYWNCNDLPEAEASYCKGLACGGLTAKKRALLLTGLARTQLDGNQPTLALRTARAALRLLLPGKDRIAVEYRGYARLVAGLACTRNGQFDDAEHLLLAARADARAVFGANSREAGKTEIALSELFSHQGRLDDALNAANRALSAVLPGFQPKRGDENPDISLFYEENTIFEALRVKANVALACYRKNGGTPWLEHALDCHDKAWQAEMLLRQVFQYRSSKLDLQQISRDREASAMDIVRLLYEKTGQAAYSQKALELAERGKAVLLAEALHENLVRQRLAGSDPRFGQLAALKQSLAYFERSLVLQPNHSEAPRWRQERDVIKAQITLLEKAVVQAYPRLAQGQWPGPYTAAVSFLSNQLPDGEILAEYFISAAWVDILVVASKQPVTWRRVPNDAELQGLVRHFSSYFENAGALLDDPAGYLKVAHTLWQQLMPPGAIQARRLTIIPDGFVNFIPFEALVTELPRATPSLRTAAYCIRRQEIRYAWSWATLQQQNTLRPRPRGFLLGVAPEFSGGQRGLAPLSAGSGEWEAVPARQVKALCGASATVSNFLADAGQYRVLHLNTHARAHQDDRFPPTIELYDTALTLPDLYALTLDAEMVVLSACQTGIGADQQGEGVMSLARAFAQTGAACVVSSLWTVNDRSSLRLFRDFYRYLNAGDPVNAALRRTKLDYLEDETVTAAYQTPYYWAGLVPVGADPHLDIPNSSGRHWAAGIFLASVLILVFWRRWKKS